MTNAEIIKAIGLMAEKEPDKYSFNNHNSSIFFKDPEKYLEVIEKWWEENKPETNIEWVKKKLEEIGYEVDINRLMEFCPPHKDSYFGKPECRDMTLDCNDCFKWWNEYHVSD